MLHPLKRTEDTITRYPQPKQQEAQRENLIQWQDTASGDKPESSKMGRALIVCKETRYLAVRNRNLLCQAEETWKEKRGGLEIFPFYQ